jgi:hypothetical protein
MLINGSAVNTSVVNGVPTYYRVVVADVAQAANAILSAAAVSSAAAVASSQAHESSSASAVSAVAATASVTQAAETSTASALVSVAAWSSQLYEDTLLAQLRSGIRQHREYVVINDHSGASALNQHGATNTLAVH